MKSYFAVFRCLFYFSFFTFSHIVRVLLSGVAFVYSAELYPIAIAIFLGGVGNFMESTNFLNILINSEIILLGGNYHLLTSALLWASVEGQAYVLNFLSSTAAETVVGLTLLVLLYRGRGSTGFEVRLGLRG